jgi:hypothetical protein
MKKKVYKCFITLMLSLVFMLAINAQFFDQSIKAEELDEPVLPVEDMPYEHISRADCGLSISSGTATVTSNVKGESGTTSISVTVYLEYLVNGSWQTYTSWSHSDGINLTSSDSTSVSHGAYRVRMHVTASGSYGTESFDVDGNTAGY